MVYCLLELLALPYLHASITVIDAILYVCKNTLNVPANKFVIDGAMMAFFRIVCSQCTFRFAEDVNYAALFTEFLMLRSIGSETIPIFSIDRGGGDISSSQATLDAVSDEIICRTIEYR